MVAERLSDIRLCSIGLVGEKSGHSDDHAVQAIATLRGLFLDESILDKVQVVNCSKAFEGHDLSSLDSACFDSARTHRTTVDKDRTRAALTKSTSVFGAVEPKIVAEDEQERGIRRKLQDVLGPIYVENHRPAAHQKLPPGVQSQTPRPTSSNRLPRIKPSASEYSAHPRPSKASIHLSPGSLALLHLCTNDCRVPSICQLSNFDVVPRREKPATKHVQIGSRSLKAHGARLETKT
jgi:hypothetical protein